MVNEELKEYILSLFKQGYGADTIKDTLVKAGHEIEKVEHLIGEAFLLINKEIVAFIEKESRKGRPLHEIKNDLLEMGHLEDDIDRIFSIRSRKDPIIKRIFEHETVSREKVWFKSWIEISIYIFAAIVIISLAISAFFVIYQPNKQLTSEKKASICTDIGKENESAFAEEYSKLCLALVSSKPDACLSIRNTKRSNECKDAFYLYSFYNSRDAELCRKIQTFSIKQYCYQLSENSCKYYLGLGEYCTSIVDKDPSKCLSGSLQPFSLIGNCADNYNMYTSLQANSSDCRNIRETALRSICKAVR